MLEIVARETGKQPIIYTMPGFANNFLGKLPKEYPLWIASLKNDKPKLPRASEDWIFWQYSHSGGVDGIKGKVDLNYFYGRVDLLNKLGH